MTIAASPLKNLWERSIKMQDIPENLKYIYNNII